jgi:Protein of unknown function (DUF2892)
MWRGTYLCDVECKYERVAVMLYTKNLPVWERIFRSVAGLAMGGCGLVGPGLAGTPVGYIIAASGVTTLLTGFVGYCPACAKAGRQAR